jgi:hypothetical protein
VFYVRDLLRSGNCHAVLSLDSDAVVNQGLAFALPLVESHVLAISPDEFGLNNGVYIVRSSPMATNLFEEWTSHFPAKQWSRDERGMSHCTNPDGRTRCKWVNEYYGQGAFTKWILPAYRKSINYRPREELQVHCKDPLDPAFVCHFYSHGKEQIFLYLDALNAHRSSMKAITDDTDNGPPCTSPRPLAPIRTRQDLGSLLRELRFSGNAVELGVREGAFSDTILQKWGGCSEYVQVDLWMPQKKYKDKANRNSTVQAALRARAKAQLDKHIKARNCKRGWQCANYTSSCALRFPDAYFDFVYVDARHDRLGVLQDLHQWWPKLRTGGLMAGHDYTTQLEPRSKHQIPGKKYDPNGTMQDWTLNFDGTRDETGRVVKGAVDDFFGGVAEGPFGSPNDVRRCPRQIVVTYREPGWNTWMVRK